MVHDKPNWFVCGHPVLPIESFQVYGHGKPPQRTLSPQIEVDIEIAQRQFAQRAVDRLAPAASRKVRFGHSSPASVLSKDGDHMVSVVLGFKVEQKRRISVRRAERRRRRWRLRDNARFAPLRPAAETRRIREVIGGIVEKFLNAVGVFHAAQFAEFRRGEAGCVAHRPHEFT